MQYENSLPINMNHDLTVPQHYAQQGLYVPNGTSRVKSENGSDRGLSPHTTDPSSRYSSNTPNQIPNYAQLATHIATDLRYPSPSSHMAAASHMPMVGNSLSLLQQGYQTSNPQEQAYAQQTPLASMQVPGQPDQNSLDNGRISNGSSGLPKAFACSTCAKGFARRSDLARHERIHSGIRPHVCEHPGCGKQFIQRSALTVHSRVHTGEKPHMCEKCGKPFSDSSSLARHRRIHSGKRPYKCPYADCQKTFTRRTTLTRHQNHHTGTIEESEAATAAALASRQALAGTRSRESEEAHDYLGDAKSGLHQPDRSSAASPANAMNGMNGLGRQPADYYLNAMTGGMAAVPAHIRTEMQPTSRSQSPAHYQMPVAAQSQRSGLTSNPPGVYSNPPQILEPPTVNGQQTVSGGNSPHQLSGGLGWQSPHNGLQASGHNDYAYPDPNQQYTNASTAQLYYQQSRPHSTGPLDYHNQLRGQEIWAQHQQ